MGLSDVFGAEERINVPFSQLFEVLKTAAKAELIENAVECNVPNEHINSMLKGANELI